MKKINTNPADIGKVIHSFARTTDEIITLDELKHKLSSGKQMIMKYGVDVTAPDLHIGHAVNLWMYRALQELGHKIVFLIGDFTTQIGDPSGKNKLRPIISIDEIKRNAEAFIAQAMLVLHDDPDTVEVRYNSEWLDKLSAKDLLSLMSSVTHEKLISRDMFRKRVEEGREIYEHELVYPILQGYDSVKLEADIAIIGSDQLFNEMMGRFFQERSGQTPQVIITTKITPGIDGKAKQSKSLGNYIGLAHSPRDKFGRIMSMPDNQVISYFKVYTEVSLGQVDEYEKDFPNDPMKYKLRLATEIVKRYHGSGAAEQELEWFTKTFRRKETPAEVREINIGSDTATLLEVLRKCFSPDQKTNSDLRRLISQKAVKVDGEVVKDANTKIALSGKSVLVKVGKLNWFKVMA